MAEKKRFIQVGITALRDPKTGGFLPAVPLYIEAAGDAEPAEATMMRDISKVFAERMKKYIDSGGTIRRKTGKSNKLSKQQAE